MPVEQAIHHGPIDRIKDVVADYAACGLDLLVLMPEVRSLRQLELLSEHVLPEYRRGRHRGINAVACRGEPGSVFPRLDEGGKTFRDISGGWPMVIASLKSLLETGHPLPANVSPNAAQEKSHA